MSESKLNKSTAVKSTWKNKLCNSFYVDIGCALSFCLFFLRRNSAPEEEEKEKAHQMSTLRSMSTLREFHSLECIF